MAADTIKHAQALGLIERHLDERVYVGFHVAGAEQADLELVHCISGLLRNPLEPRPPRLEPDVGYYHVEGDEGDRDSLGLYPLAGSVVERDHGIDFRPSDNVLIRVAWDGSPEVGDGRAKAAPVSRGPGVWASMPEPGRLVWATIVGRGIDAVGEHADEEVEESAALGTERRGSVVEDGEPIAHNEALRLIEEHIGENVYAGFHVAAADDEGSDPNFIVARQAGLSNPLDPRPPRLGPNVGYYGVGGRNPFALPPMAGTVWSRDNGVDFRPSETVLIRIAWRGSREVGDRRPTRQALARLNAVGIKLPEHERPGIVLPSERGERADD